MKRLQATITVTWDIDDLKHYNASNVHDAADFTKNMIEDGTFSIEDIIDWGKDSIEVEVKGFEDK